MKYDFEPFDASDQIVPQSELFEEQNERLNEISNRLDDISGSLDSVQKKMDAESKRSFIYFLIASLLSAIAATAAVLTALSCAIRIFV